MLSHFRAALVSMPALVLIMIACGDPDTDETNATGPERAVVAAGTHRQYGVPQKVGNGMVRTYIVFDEKNDRPLEIGVAMSEAALEGLPATAMPPVMDEKHNNGHVMSNIRLLDLPAKNPTQYKFVQFDWNPNGHEPDSVYTSPHFDFHFYRVPLDVVKAIVPTDPEFATKAAKLPPQSQWAPFYVDGGTAGNVPQSLATVPMMGLHWLDVRSPELQKLTGHPELFQAFTKTYIVGSWDGQFIFDEPMITRAYILSKRSATDPAVRDEIIPIPVAAQYSPAGFYPKAYRIAYDAKAKEYLIALTQLEAKN